MAFYTDNLTTVSDDPNGWKDCPIALVIEEITEERAIELLSQVRHNNGSPEFIFWNDTKIPREIEKRSFMDLCLSNSNS
jgi:hypothetical protein